ncbi:MAG: hypothetical protein DLM54_05155 [Acidimicrobiales bacterium]|nr:MAG: hypothetical protein DLM54_05155 [Acidimicrobiales bacterium]
MPVERYVLLGLASPRAGWFNDLARWANSLSIPVEFVKCLSAEELLARLGSGRAFSAAIIDAGLSALDRDLIDAIARSNCAVLVVDDSRRSADWGSLGASVALAEDFDRQALLDALRSNAVPVAAADEVPGLHPEIVTGGRRGQVALVCGPGGTGASTIAIALAQGLALAHPTGTASVGTDAGDARERWPGGSVLVADLARYADQAMLHDAGDVVPGVQELVEAHRNGAPDPADVVSLIFDVKERGYHLLLGLRRPHAWAAMRPRAFEAAFDNLRRAYSVIVCDVEADFEGEREGGSLDVEERNVMSRTAATHADVVLVVGLPGLKGLHGLIRAVNELISFGVSVGRIVPVVNRAPRQQRARAQLTSTLGAMTNNPSAACLASPIFLPERRIDECVQDGVRLPDSVTAPITGAFMAMARRLPAATIDEPDPEPLVPGSIGHWDTDSPGSQAAWG